MGALAISGALSRTVIVLMLTFMPPARTQGNAAAAGHPSTRMAFSAAGLGLGVFLLVSLTMPVDPITGIASLTAMALAVLALSVLAWRQIRGQTGDVLGAAQVLAELAVLGGLASGLSG